MIWLQETFKWTVERDSYKLRPYAREFLTCSNHTGLETLLHLYNKDHKQFTASLVHDTNKAF